MIVACDKPINRVLKLDIIWLSTFSSCVYRHAEIYWYVSITINNEYDDLDKF